MEHNLHLGQKSLLLLLIFCLLVVCLLLECKGRRVQ